MWLSSSIQFGYRDTLHATTENRLVVNAIAIKMKRVTMTKASTTQRNEGIRAMSCINTAKPRLNRVRASYAEAEEPMAAWLIQMVPKPKKQLSNRTNRIVGADPADNLRRSFLRYLSTSSFLQ
jgi:hypothetical protein